jgi:hypothetical protein
VGETGSGLRQMANSVISDVEALDFTVRESGVRLIRRIIYLRRAGRSDFGTFELCGNGSVQIGTAMLLLLVMRSIIKSLSSVVGQALQVLKSLRKNLGLQ